MKKNIFALMPLLALCSCSFSGAEEMSALEEVYIEPPAIVDTLDEAEEPFIPAPGGSIKIDCMNPKTFNPVLNEDLSVDRLLRLIYEPLIALDESMRPSPALASSWEFSPDGLSLTLRLREDAFWEDGEEVTASDVKYTLDVIKSLPETGLYRLCLENIADYSAVDAKTFSITYEKPFSGALYNLTIPVIPQHHFSRGRTASEITEPLGSGRYKLEEFNVMREVKLTASGSSFRGKPNITEVVAIIVRDLESGLYAYDQNILDIVETRRADWKKISTARQSNVFRRASQGYEFLALNFRNEALCDVYIRRAIAHCIPKTEIIDKYYAGNAFAANTPVNPQSWLYEPDAAVYEYNPEKAREYMRLSEQSFGEDDALKILVNDDNPERLLTAERLRDELLGVKIPCELEIREFDDYVYRLYAGYFDIAVCGFEMSLNPDLEPLLGNVGDVLGAHNLGAYKDEVLDGYLAQAQLSVFESAQSAAYSAIQKHFGRELPHISVLYKADVLLSGQNVYGEARPVTNNAYDNLGELYVATQEKTITGEISYSDGTKVEAFSYSQDASMYISGSPGIKTEGFNNAQKSTVTKKEEAIDLAKNEVTIEYDKVDVYYDNTYSMWLVCFSAKDILGGGQSVYIDKDGLTVLIVYGE